MSRLPSNSTSTSSTSSFMEFTPKNEDGNEDSISVYHLIKKLATCIKNENNKAPNYIEQLKIDGGIVDLKRRDKRISKDMRKIYDQLLNLRGTSPIFENENQFFIAEDYIFQLRQNGENLKAEKFEKAYNQFLLNHSNSNISGDGETVSIYDVTSKHHDILRMLFTVSKCRADHKEKIENPCDVSKDFQRVEFCEQKDLFGINSMNMNNNNNNSKSINNNNVKKDDMFGIRNIKSDIKKFSMPLSTDMNQLLELKRPDEYVNSNAKNENNNKNILFGAVRHRPLFSKSNKYKTLNFSLSLPGLGVAPVDIFERSTDRAFLARGNENVKIQNTNEIKHPNEDTSIDDENMIKNTSIDNENHDYIHNNKLNHEFAWENVQNQMSFKYKSAGEYFIGNYQNNQDISSAFKKKTKQLSHSAWNESVGKLEQRMSSRNLTTENIFSIQDQASNRIVEGENISFKDLFLLIQGVPSSSFTFDPSKMKFIYEDDLINSNNGTKLTSLSIKNMIQQWILCGTCLRRLEGFALYYKSNTGVNTVDDNSEEYSGDVIGAYANGILHYITIHCAFASAIFSNVFDPSVKNEIEDKPFDIIHATTIMMPWIERITWLADDICILKNFDVDLDENYQFSKFPYKGENLLTYLYNKIVLESTIMSESEPIRLTLIKYLFQYALIPWLQNVNKLFFQNNASTRNIELNYLDDFLVSAKIPQEESNIKSGMGKNVPNIIKVDIKNFNDIPCFIDLQAYNTISKAARCIKIIQSLGDDNNIHLSFEHIYNSKFQIDKLLFAEEQLKIFEEQLEDWITRSDILRLEISGRLDEENIFEEWNFDDEKQDKIIIDKNALSTAAKLKQAAEEDRQDELERTVIENERKRQLLNQIEFQIAERRRQLNNMEAKEREFDDFFISQLALNTPRALGGGGVLDEENALKVAATKLLYERYGQNIKQVQNRTKLLRWRLQRSQTLESSKIALKNLLADDERNLSKAPAPKEEINGTKQVMENNNELGKDAIEMENGKEEPVVVDVKLGVESNTSTPENFIKSENGDNQKETAVDNAEYDEVKTSVFINQKPGGTSTAQNLIYNAVNNNNNNNETTTNVRVTQSPGGNSTLDNSMSGEAIDFKTGVVINQEPGGTSTAQNLIYDKNVKDSNIDDIDEDGFLIVGKESVTSSSEQLSRDIKPQKLNFQAEEKIDGNAIVAKKSTLDHDAIASAYADAYINAMDVHSSGMGNVLGNKNTNYQLNTIEQQHIFVANVGISDVMERCVIRPVMHQCTLINKACVSFFMKNLKLNRVLEYVHDFLLMSKGHIMQEFIQTVWKGYANPNALTNWSLEGNINRAFLNAYTTYNYNNNESLGSIAYHFVESNFKYEIVWENRLSLQNINAYDLHCLDHVKPTLNITWPLTMVVTEKSIGRYRRIHTFLLRLQVVRQTLCESWLNAMKIRRSSSNLNDSLNLESIKLPHLWYVYQQNVDHFVKTFSNYIVSDAIESLWYNFYDNIGGVNAKKMDDIYMFQETHEEFTIRLMERTFVDNINMMKAINELLSRAISLSHMVQHVSSSRYDVDKDSKGQDIIEIEKLKSDFDGFLKTKEIFIQMLKEMCKGRGMVFWARDLLNKFI